VRFCQRDGIDKSLDSFPEHVTLESSVVGNVEETVSQFEFRVGVSTAWFTVDLHLGCSAIHCVPHPVVLSVN
jgi:hypothetical protein